jgi:hypothetical protein
MVTPLSSVLAAFWLREPFAIAGCHNYQDWNYNLFRLVNQYLQAFFSHFTAKQDAEGQVVRFLLT